MAPGLIVAAIVIGSIALVGVIIWLVYLAEKKRTEKLADAASEHGLEFAEKDEALLGKMQVFELFNKGHSRKMKNVMKATTEVAQMAIFDYQYTTGHGKNQTTHSHTVVSMDSTELQMPSFSMYPEGFFQRIGSMLGFQDIDFDSNPEFSNAFVLKGDDEEAVRRFFDAELLDFFAKRKGISIETKPGTFIYRRGGRVKPEEIRALMDEAFQVYSTIVERTT